MTTGHDTGAAGPQDAQALSASNDAADSGFSDREVGGAVLPCEAGLRFRLAVDAEPPPVLELTSEVIPPPPPPIGDERP